MTVWVGTNRGGVSVSRCVVFMLACRCSGRVVVHVDADVAVAGGACPCALQLRQKTQAIHGLNKRLDELETAQVTVMGLTVAVKGSSRSMLTA